MPGAGRLSATFVGLIAGATLLAGCAMPDVASMSPNLPERPSASPAPTPAAAPAAAGAAGQLTAASAGSAPSAVAPVDRGDMFRGSLTSKLQVGFRNLVVDYWLDADPATLSATTPTVVQLSAHFEDSDTEHALKVSRFLATTDEGGASTTLAEDRGEFVITPPFSYGSAMTIRPVDRTATAVTLTVQFDLLLESVPGSGAYFRQTVIDTVRIALPATPRGTAS
jgi:hypothetical protein